MVDLLHSEHGGTGPGPAEMAAIAVLCVCDSKERFSWRCGRHCCRAAAGLQRAAREEAP